MLSSTLLGAIAIAGVWGVSGCSEASDSHSLRGASDARSPQYELPEIQQLAWDDVARLRLVKIDSVVLGDSSGGFVNDITDFKRFNEHYYVLDRYDKAIKIFDSSGRLLRQIGRQGRGPGEFVDPFEMAFADSDLYVADPGQGNAVSVFDLQGNYRETRRPDVPRTPTSIAASDDRLFVLTPAVQFPESEGWDILTVLHSSGEVAGRGCRLDRRYVDSRAAGGFLNRNQYGKVAARDGRAYCIQTISPIVQILDTTGHLVDMINVAPPFYRAPIDQTFIDNQKAIFDFLSSWTIHSRFFPLDDGWASVYNTYSPTDQEMQFSLFICATPRNTERRCGAVENIRRPLLLTALDTVYILDDIEPEETARFSIYRIVGLTPGGQS